MHEDIRRIIAEHGHLAVDISSISDDHSLFDAGMSSHSAVGLMMAIEDHFSIEVPDAELKRSNFESVAAIARLLGRIQTTP